MPIPEADTAVESRRPAEPAPKPSHARSTLGIYATRLITFPLSLLTTFGLAWTLDATLYGKYRFMVSLGSFILPLMTFGFGASIVYFLSSKRYSAKDVLPTCIVVSLVQGLANAAVLAALWQMGWLGETASEIPARYMLPILATMPLQAALLLLTRVLLGDSWFRLNNWLTLATPLVTSLSLLVLVVGLKFDLGGAVTAVIVSNLVLVGWLAAMVWLRYRPPLSINRPFIADAANYGIKAWPADVAVRLNLRLDLMLLGFFYPAESFGAYSMALTISELLWMVPDSLAFVLFNRIAAEKNSDERIRLTGQVHRVLFVVVAVASTLTTLAAYWLIPIVLPAKFSIGRVPLLLLLPGTIVFTTTKVVSKYFGASGMPGKSSITAVAGAVVGVGLYAILIPKFGMEGAAIGSSLCYATMSIIAALLFRNMIAPAHASLFRVSWADVRWARDLLRGALPSRLRRATRMGT